MSDKIDWYFDEWEKDFHKNEPSTARFVTVWTLLFLWAVLLWGLFIYWVAT